MTDNKGAILINKNMTFDEYARKLKKIVNDKKAICINAKDYNFILYSIKRFKKYEVNMEVYLRFINSKKSENSDIMIPYEDIMILDKMSDSRLLVVYILNNLEAVV